MSSKTPRLIRPLRSFLFPTFSAKQLRVSVGKLEWRRRLRTKNPVLARFRALVLSTAVDELMTHRNSDDWDQHGVVDLEMFRGTVSQTSFNPREVVKDGLRRNSSAVIFMHNQPSGSAEPSRADEAITHTLKSALSLVDVR